MTINQSELAAYINSLTEDMTPDSATDFIMTYDASEASGKKVKISIISPASTTFFKYPAMGRLTLTSATPVTTADVTAATTLYYTPYQGDQIALFNGATWDILSFTELSIAVPATTSQMYDVFCYNNGGTATLELLAWTSDTVRATALALQNGILCKTGALTRRYLGSMRTTAVSGKTEDSIANRLVWNYYHRVMRRMFAEENTAHYYNGAYRKWNNADTNNLLAFIIGYVEDTQILGGGNVAFSAQAGDSPFTTLYLNGAQMTTTAPDVGWVGTTNYIKESATYPVYPALGYNYLQMYEYSDRANCRFSGLKLQATILG
jgi:hypothetical protein